MTLTDTIIEVLGGAKVLRGRVLDLEDLRERVRAGLPYASLETVSSRFGLAREEVSEALLLPARTIARRKKESWLRADESDRLFRLARVAAQASQTLGDEGKASLWLRRPNRALGNRAPLSLLDTDIGARQVEDVLGRIEHGVYS
jgi:putative toxin-antitoxin system antitoxin component (TIGR02293 family)